MNAADASDVTAREMRELSFLFEISRALSRSINLSDVLEPVLAAMERHLGMVRGTITLVNRHTGEIKIEAAHGLTESQRNRGCYSLGEGITGRVIETGKAAVIPKISDEPCFLDRTGARSGLNKEHISFLCVPIVLGNEVVGALSADRPFSGESELNADLRLLTIVASMISQAVRIRQEAEEERERLINENAMLRNELLEHFRPANIIGNARAMREVFKLVAQVAGSNTTVLVRGETGTGKELVARSIHYESRRASGPFVCVHCGALPETMIESELFGHEKGAFTGAVCQRRGRFELAHGGTLFLDEIGDIPLGVQVKLLRVLQEREFERVGGHRSLRVDVRLIAATNRNLEDLIAQRLFREDLYYRLNVFPIYVPPLRDRKSDIPLLADYFLQRYARASGKNVKRISTTAIDMLMAYHWPGNVRELENCIERAVVLAEGDVIHTHHLPSTVQMPVSVGAVGKSTLRDALDTVERDMILDALRASGGNMAAAARLLGISERIMGLRVRKYGVDRRKLRAKGLSVRGALT